MTITLPKVLSAFVFILLVIGFANHHRKRVHIPLMVSAFVIDLSLVLFLEIRRGVIESIPHRTMTPLLGIHIVLSTVVLILYGVQLYGGINNARGRRSRIHGKVGTCFLIIRFGNLITSWFVV